MVVCRHFVSFFDKNEIIRNLTIIITWHTNIECLKLQHTSGCSECAVYNTFYNLLSGMYVCHKVPKMSQSDYLMSNIHVTTLTNSQPHGATEIYVRISKLFITWNIQQKNQNIPLAIYTVNRKTPTILFVHNFAKCWQSFKILSPLDLQRNLQ